MMNIIPAAGKLVLNERIITFKAIWSFVFEFDYFVKDQIYNKNNKSRVSDDIFSVSRSNTRTMNNGWNKYTHFVVISFKICIYKQKENCFVVVATRSFPFYCQYFLSIRELSVRGRLYFFCVKYQRKIRTNWTILINVDETVSSYSLFNV